MPANPSCYSHPFPWKWTLSPVGHSGWVMITYDETCPPSVLCMSVKWKCFLSSQHNDLAAQSAKNMSPFKELRQFMVIVNKQMSLAGYK